MLGHLFNGYNTGEATRENLVLGDMRTSFFALAAEWCHGHIQLAACLWRPYGDLSPPNRTTALRFLYKPYDDLTVFSTPQGHRKSCGFFFNLTLNFFQKPQCHNAATTQQDHRTVAVRSPCDGREVAYGFYPVFGCLENRTAASRRPCGALTAAVRQACSSCNDREVAVRSPPGLLAVTLQVLISWIERSP